MGVQSWLGKITLSRKWQPTPVIPAWKIPRIEERASLQSIWQQRVSPGKLAVEPTLSLRGCLQIHGSPFLELAYWSRLSLSTENTGLRAPFPSWRRHFSRMQPCLCVHQFSSVTFTSLRFSLLSVLGHFFCLQQCFKSVFAVNYLGSSGQSKKSLQDIFLSYCWKWNSL